MIKNLPQLESLHVTCKIPFYGTHEFSNLKRLHLTSVNVKDLVNLSHLQYLNCVLCINVDHLKCLKLK